MKLETKVISHTHQPEVIDTQVRVTTDHSVALTDYYDNVQQMNKRTAREYLKRLRSFSAYVQEKYGCIIDVLIKRLVRGELNPYEVLSGYVSFLNRQGTVSELSLKQRVVTAKNFLEYCDVEISPRRFKLKVRMPKVIRKNKEALTKEVITDILNACSDLRIRTYVHLLAATGLRANEALSTRVCDYHFNDSNDPLNPFHQRKIHED